VDIFFFHNFKLHELERTLILKSKTASKKIIENEERNTEAVQDQEIIIGGATSQNKESAGCSSKLGDSMREEEHLEEMEEIENTDIPRAPSGLTNSEHQMSEKQAALYNSSQIFIGEQPVIEMLKMEQVSTPKASKPATITQVQTKIEYKKSLEKFLIDKYISHGVEKDQKIIAKKA